MKALTTYHLNTPDTINGNSISITTTYYGTEEEVDYIKKSCEESISSGLLQEYGSPLTSQGHIKKSEVRWTDKVYLDSYGNIRSMDSCPTDQMTQDTINKIMTNIGCARPIEDKENK